MRKIKPYKGKVLAPDRMTLQQLKAYIKWGDSYLEWCLDADGRVNSYDRMSTSLSPYIDELSRRIAKIEGRV